MIKDFKALRISIASPQQVMSWSHGEVKKAETINYRTHRAEVDGLMDEKIFGPTKNFECYCGKYKKIRYKGIICDKCGVEVTHKRVRRERMGHIRLAAPVVHVWYSYGVPNKLSLILDITQKKLETVIYFARYLVTNVQSEKQQEIIEKIKSDRDSETAVLKSELSEKLTEIENVVKADKATAKKDNKEKAKLEFILEKLNNKEKKEVATIKSVYDKKEENIKKRYNNLITLIEGLRTGSTLSEEDLATINEYSSEFIEVGMGAEAIKKLLVKIDLDKEIAALQDEKVKTKSAIKKRRIVQRSRVLEGMKRAGIDPFWVVMDLLPVIPPDLRPIIQLPGGRFATSDLNDLYRRVINRNNRLKRLIELGAPEIILRNEKRMLQEAVDALIDNDHRPGNAVLNSRGQPYKSLSDMLRGKQGRFRQNLLGKRVDYSGRSVIVPGPDLKISEVGLPKTMALELFKPFVLREIIAEGLAPNIKSAKHFFESKSTEVWDILEKVIQNRPVLLNRAPTLHRQGIQAFFPILTEGNAIRLHPMVCKGFNADFDGDQMAVHVPLSDKAVEEAKEKLFAHSNLLLMADGSPVVSVTKDMALGIYYMTGIDETIIKEHKKYFGTINDAIGRFQMEDIDLREPIKLLLEGKMVETTVGRIIVNQSHPEGFRFVNKQMDKGDVSKISAEILDKYGETECVNYLDQIEMLGFKYATEFGLSVGMDDFIISDQKDILLEEVEKKDDQLTVDYYNGLLTKEERKRLSEKLWMDLIEKVSDETWKTYEKDKNNNLVILQESGALPVQAPLRQISGIRGLILDPLGNIVELPLRSNYKQGLTTLEYFVAARGTRKGLADTALRTAESGYLTRRLVDVAQDVIVKQEDCGATEGVVLLRGANRRLSFQERINGRFCLEKVTDSKTGELVADSGTEITPEVAEKIDKSGVESIHVRSVLGCKTGFGICQKCYGYSLGTRRLVQKGIAIGVIAAQSMGEAATQLTLNTKHLAGRVGTDITQGLPRVEELFEARTPKSKAILTELDGKIEFVKDIDDKLIAIKVKNRKQMRKVFELIDGDKPNLKRSKQVKTGDLIYTTAAGEEVKAELDGQIGIEGKTIVYIVDKEVEAIYDLTAGDIVSVEDGTDILRGDALTLGSKDPKEIMKLSKLSIAQAYLINNIQETYGIQGIGIDDKHVEVVVRQMSRLCKVTDPGDSDYLPGEYVDHVFINDDNIKFKKEDKKTIKYERNLLGITFASIKTDSFLSAASFEQQVRVLSDAAIVGKQDHLRGLKENVIIGRTVPLGEEVR
ncbi:MAG: DNA-directed RNA polymerase subunit beta' [bacterium]